MLKLKDNTNPQEPHKNYVSPDILLRNVESIDGLSREVTDDLLDSLMSAGYVTIGEVLSDGYCIVREKLCEVGRDRFMESQTKQAFHRLFYTFSTDRTLYLEQRARQEQDTHPDWEQRRYDLAKSVLVAWAPLCGRALVNHVEDAVTVADKVIEQLTIKNKLFD